MTAPVSDKPKTTIVEHVTNFASGVVGGAGKDTAAGTIGDIVSAGIPGLGTTKAIADVFDGVREKDFAKLLGGIISLLPGAGSAVSAVKSAGTKAAAQVGKVVAEKGAKAATLHFASIAARSATELAKNPDTKKKLIAGGQRAAQRAIEIFKGRLEQMASKKEAVSMVTEEHSDFSAARKSMAEWLGVSEPGSRGMNLKDWTKLEDADGQVIGKQKLVGEGDEVKSERGFRLIEPEQGASDAEKARYRILSWIQEGNDPRFRIDSYQASAAEQAAIRERYTGASKAWRKVG